MSSRGDGCYDTSLTFRPHGPLAEGQRYVTGNGQCRKLDVQSTQIEKKGFGPFAIAQQRQPTSILPTTQAPSYNRVPVTNKVPLFIKLALELVLKPTPEKDAPVGEWVIFLGKWFLKWCLLFLTLLASLISKI